MVIVSCMCNWSFLQHLKLTILKSPLCSHYSRCYDMVCASIDTLEQLLLLRHKVEGAFTCNEWHEGKREGHSSW
jgi:hypothetical protein